MPNGEWLQTCLSWPEPSDTMSAVNIHEAECPSCHKPKGYVRVLFLCNDCGASMSCNGREGLIDAVRFNVMEHGLGIFNLSKGNRLKIREAEVLSGEFRELWKRYNLEGQSIK